MDDLEETARELTIAIAKRATSGDMFDFQACYALCLDALRAERERQKETAEALRVLLWAIQHDFAWAPNQPYITRIEAAIDRAVVAIRALD